MKLHILFITTGLMLLLLFSCEKDRIMSYEGGAGINFASDSLMFSFLANDDPYYIIDIKLKINGDTADYDRTFNVNVANDELSEAAANKYEIMERVVPAGEMFGSLKVKLLKITETADTTFTININLTDSKDFMIGNIENSSLKLKWTNKIIVPAWGYFKYFMCRTASTSCYKAIIKSTGMMSFSRTELTQLGMEGAKVMGIKFGDYVKQWNLDNPNDKLIHSDGDKKGQEIVPLYYSTHLYE